MSTPVIIGMSTVRNEADIVAQALEHALPVHKVIYVVDCGSEDDTSQILENLARSNPRIHFLGRIGPHYAEQVRWQIWSKYRKQWPINTWWSIIDADEFMVDDPQLVIQQAEKENADHVMIQHIEFYYKYSEFIKWEKGEESLADRKRPIVDRRRWYAIGGDNQIRMFRNLPWLRWNSETSYPVRFSKTASLRPIVRHYKYRDGAQLEYRIKSRNHWDRKSAVMTDNPHWFQMTTEDCLSSDSDPNLNYWAHQTDLPRAANYKKQPAMKTLLKYMRAAVGGFCRKQRVPILFST